MRTCHLMMHCAAYIVGTGRERERTIPYMDLIVCVGGDCGKVIIY